MIICVQIYLVFILFLNSTYTSIRRIKMLHHIQIVLVRVMVKFPNYSTCCGGFLLLNKILDETKLPRRAFYYSIHHFEKSLPSLRLIRSSFVRSGQARFAKFKYQRFLFQIVCLSILPSKSDLVNLNKASQYCQQFLRIS